MALVVNGERIEVEVATLYDILLGDVDRPMPFAE